MDGEESDEETDIGKQVSPESQGSVPGIKREMPPSPFTSGKTIILAKNPDVEKRESSSSPARTSVSSSSSKSLTSSSATRRLEENPTRVVLKSRTEGARITSLFGASQPNPPHGIIAGGDSAILAVMPPGEPPIYHIQKNPTVLGSAHLTSEGGVRNPLAAPLQMKHCVKVVDENMQWCDNGIEMLLDQTDFFTVGVVGLQGTGKSTILSYLAGNSLKTPEKSMIFLPEDRTVCETGVHQTVGIDMYMTHDRVMLLDTQPILSASVLDYIIRHEKKMGLEYASVENVVELHSLQQVTFLMTVCNVVLFVIDNFIDLQLIKFLHRCEMLKPTVPSGGHDSSGVDGQEHVPQLVFVFNKAERNDFTTDSLVAMETTLNTVMRDSKVKWAGSLKSNSPGHPSHRDSPLKPNLVLLPIMESSNDADDLDATLEGRLGFHEFKGHIGFPECLRNLRNSLFSLPRSLITHSSLTEKNWYHFASRTWDTTKKSPLLSEYNRLLP